jgi:hypothetical protein
VKLDHLPHLVRRLRKHGTKPPILHTSTWRTKDNDDYDDDDDDDNNNNNTNSLA